MPAIVGNFIMMLNIDLDRFLAGQGKAIATQSDPNDVRRFMQMVRPVRTTVPLVRVGGEADGGYLVPDILSGVSMCFSPGVGPTSAFESALAARGIPSFMADASVEGPAQWHPLMHFERKFLGDVNDAMTVRLEDWVSAHAPGVGADLLLQMDIEGAEYPVLLDTPAATLRRFSTMIIEFHTLDALLVSYALPFYVQTFRKLLADFHVVHIHPNNNVRLVTRGEFEIPPVTEFTFLRKDLAQVLGPAQVFPHPLDTPNTHLVPDIVLPECWWKPA